LRAPPEHHRAVREEHDVLVAGDGIIASVLAAAAAADTSAVLLLLLLVVAVPVAVPVAVLLVGVLVRFPSGPFELASLSEPPPKVGGRVNHVDVERVHPLEPVYPRRGRRRRCSPTGRFNIDTGAAT
ncbi:unnamed protein product, partial [Ectocarpus sp. 12 AP-2014]